MSYRRRDDHRRPPPFSNWRKPAPEDDFEDRQQQRPPKPKPPSTRKRDSARQDRFRENNSKSQKEIDKPMYSLFGNLNISVQKLAVGVPVTTRAVGFYTQSLFKNIHELYGCHPDRIPECSPYAFYRVTLAQFEFRLLCAKYTLYAVSLTSEKFYRPRLTLEERDVIKSMAITFAPIANMLAGVGCFEYESDTYYAHCPRDPILGILYSNLREVVETMSNPQTPHEIRAAFYALNPLPFAEWNQPQRAGVRRRVDQPVVDADSPVLLNPGDFMPPNYGIEDFELDVDRVKNFITFVTRKMLSERAVIDYDAPGHQRIFVSNDAQGVRNPDRLFGGQWADEDLSHGDLISFWTPVTISSQDFFMGVRNLVGEIRTGVGDAFAFRSQLRAVGLAKHHWTALIFNTT